MLETYAPLIIYGGLLAVVGGGMLAITVILPRLLKIQRPNPVKTEAYECGVPPVTEGARGRISVRFYLVAILFILFDVETVFLIPWAVSHRRLGEMLGLGAFVEVLVFIGVLVVAYLYVWKRGALDWE